MRYQHFEPALIASLKDALVDIFWYKSETIEPFVELINGFSDFGVYSYSESVGVKQVPDDAFAEISEP